MAKSKQILSALKDFAEDLQVSKPSAKRVNPHGMNDKQLLFCKHYVANGRNGQESYKAVYGKGLSDDTARSNASRLLAEDNISAWMAENLEKQLNRLEITEEHILLEMARCGFFDIRKAFDSNNAIRNIQDLDDDTAAAIGGVEIFQEFDYIDGDKVYKGDTVKFKSVSKIDALRELGRNLGIFGKDNKQRTPVTNLNIEALTSEDLLLAAKLQIKATKG